ncbi:hypothetical protein DEDE109153_12740 [Deinococcus deserti]
MVPSGLLGAWTYSAVIHLTRDFRTFALHPAALDQWAVQALHPSSSFQKGSVLCSDCVLTLRARDGRGLYYGTYGSYAL